MMAMSEDRHETGAAARLKTMVLAVLLSMVLLFACGVIAGAIAALVEDTSKGGAKSALVIGGAAALAVAAGLGLLRLKPWAHGDEPISPKTRKANNLLLLSGALGALIGTVLAIGTISTDDPFSLFSNKPMAPAVVVPVIAIWLLLVPLISWQWHRSVDEHEAGAYRFGGLAGLYLYTFLAPAWWFAWRGGLVPAPETMAIYLAVMSVWGAGWLWRRYH